MNRHVEWTSANTIPPPPPMYISYFETSISVAVICYKRGNWYRVCLLLIFTESLRYTPSVPYDQSLLRQLSFQRPRKMFLFIIRTKIVSPPFLLAHALWTFQPASPKTNYHTAHVANQGFSSYRYCTTLVPNGRWALPKPISLPK